MKTFKNLILLQALVFANQIYCSDSLYSTPHEAEQLREERVAGFALLRAERAAHAQQVARLRALGQTVEADRLENFYETNYEIRLQEMVHVFDLKQTEYEKIEWKRCISSFRSS